jgi:hypothetical protein
MDEEPAAVGVKEQVSRVQSARNAMNDDKPVEERWGASPTAEPGVSRFVLRLFAILVPVLAIVIAVMLVRGGSGGEQVEPPGKTLNLGLSQDDRDYQPEGPLAWFIVNPQAAYDQSIRILEQLNESSGATLPQGVFRRPEFAEAEILQRGLGWNSPFVTKDFRKFHWTNGNTDKIGYLIAEGLCENQGKYRAYFVNTPDGVRMDWAASTGWSEIPLKELPRESLDKPVLVRGILSKEPHFDTLRGPGSKQSWFLVTLPGSDVQIWAYAPADSELAQDLLNLLGFGRLVLERQPEARVVLRLSKPEGELKANQFRIEELTTSEWVLP